MDLFGSAGKSRVKKNSHGSHFFAQHGVIPLKTPALSAPPSFPSGFNPSFSAGFSQETR